MSNTKRIFIIGHSGAGKGVLAQAVAKKLGWKFLNTDVLGCAAHIGRTVSEVVGAEGERAFNRCLTETCPIKSPKKTLWLPQMKASSAMKKHVSY